MAASATLLLLLHAPSTAAAAPAQAALVHRVPQKINRPSAAHIGNALSRAAEDLRGAGCGMAVRVGVPRYRCGTFRSLQRGVERSARGVAGGARPCTAPAPGTGHPRRFLSKQIIAV